MNYIESSLIENEKVVMLFKLHWIKWIPVVFYALTIIALPMAIYRLIQILSTEMGLTDKRIILKTGFLSRETSEQFLKKTESIELSQTILGRILGYGDVRCTATGGSTFILLSVDNPIFVKRNIENQLH